VPVSMQLDAFDFHLPDENIALRPARPRDTARMLVVRPGETEELSDRSVGDLIDLLQPGDVLVFNNTRVIPAQLEGKRIGRGDTAPKIGVTLHKRKGDDVWSGFTKPARKLEVGDRVAFAADCTFCYGGALMATVVAKGEGGEVDYRFDRGGEMLDIELSRVGVMPLPPYIASKRKVDQHDKRDYQTVYAEREGAVAAPTAGLHFTEEMLARLEEKGVERRFVTLHVGAGTFLPVKVENIAEHRMHAEWGEIDAETAQALNTARARGGRIVAVGTTSLRLLESAADEDGIIHPFCDDTAIFITPGYRFRAVDVLMTNFHLPKSTLFMLVSAFSGLETMQRAYAHAIETGYRFYSYGDASLLFPGPQS